MVVSFCATGGSDQSAAAGVGWVVAVSDVLEALVLHFFSGMRRTEGKGWNVGRQSRADTSWC